MFVIDITQALLVMLFNKVLLSSVNLPNSLRFMIILLNNTFWGSSGEFSLQNISIGLMGLKGVPYCVFVM